MLFSIEAGSMIIGERNEYYCVRQIIFVQVFTTFVAIHEKKISDKFQFIVYITQPRVTNLYVVFNNKVYQRLEFFKM